MAKASATSRSVRSPQRLVGEDQGARGTGERAYRYADRQPRAGGEQAAVRHDAGERPARVDDRVELRVLLRVLRGAGAPVEYSRVGCRLRRAIFSVSTDRLSSSTESRYALIEATSSGIGVPGVGELEGEHDAGQWRAHHPADDGGEPGHRPEAGEHVRQRLALQRPEEAADHEHGGEHAIMPIRRAWSAR
jgi:hypothetical protein